jgi:hypothetical protein
VKTRDTLTVEAAFIDQSRDDDDKKKKITATGGVVGPMDPFVFVVTNVGSAIGSAIFLVNFFSFFLFTKCR